MKRFTATEKWMDRWFRSLSPQGKLAWLYVLDNCDAAGVIEIDEELANFQLGIQVDWDGFAKASEGRLIPLAKGKQWVSGFIKFQYGEVSPECKAHRPVFASIEKHGLTERVSKGYSKGIQRDKEKEKDKDKSKPTLEEVHQLVVDRGYHFDPEAFFAHYEANGWVQGRGKPIRNWKSACTTWERNWIRDHPPLSSRLPTAEDDAKWTP